jgi:hypothetical protein
MNSQKSLGMNPKELIEASKNSPSVSFHKFVLLSRGRENHLFCFFEGNDSVYYSSRIKASCSTEYHPISCGNKKAVLGVYLMLNNDVYKKYKKAFFVDSDFDDHIGNPEIFETPCYSVENFYVNTYTIKEILKNEFKLIEEDESFQSVISLFEKQLNEFNQATLLFNAWYAALKSKNSTKSIKVSLDDKLPKDFVCVKVGEIKSKYTLANIKEHFKECLEEVTEDEVEKSRQVLCSKDLSNCLRGKFQFWFLYEFLNYIIEDSNTSNKIMKTKTKFNLNRGQMISQLSQYAYTPQELRTYLQKFA